LGTPHFFGSVVDTENDRFWLFLERVAGRELYQVGDAGVWQDAARWLAHFHHQFSSSEALPPHTVRRLVRLDEPYYRQWFERAAEFAGSEKGIRNESVCRLAAHAPALVEQLLELPVGLIHGEFYASNIIVADTNRDLRICPLDWERAAIGPGLIDLASLVAGRWSEDARHQMAAAYQAEQLRLAGAALPMDQLLRHLDLCRLHLAVQWLGWSPDWTPPADHRHDWLAEAVHLAQRLGYDV
jgi:aminoglycoside phosphotransferase (APT) family kinase protein